MKIVKEELKGMLEIKEVPFDEEFLELKPIDRTEACKYFFSSNISETITRTYNDGLMKDFCVKGLKVNRSIEDQKASYCQRVAEYALFKDNDEDQSAEMQILLIYEILIGKGYSRKSKKIYVACQTNVKFPSLIIYNNKHSKDIVSLFPYISKVYVYGSTDKKELERTIPGEQDLYYAISRDSVDEQLFKDVQFILISKENIENCFLHIDDGRMLFSIELQDIETMNVGSLYQLRVTAIS